MGDDYSKSSSIEPRYTPEEVAPRIAPGGTLNPATIRQAIRDGELVAEKLGRRWYVTEPAANTWMERCRNDQKDLDLSSDPAPDEKPPGTSETPEASSRAQDAANSIANELIDTFRSTS